VIWLGLSAAFMVTTALVHGLLGERRLVGPLMSLNSGIMGIDLARRVFRLAWHALSLLMLVSAASVLWPGTPRGLILLIGAAWTATGLFDAVYTRGRHIGWPFLTTSGLLAIAGAL
jgi:predicted anti-sigma-YlaC factor YlaD